MLPLEDHAIETTRPTVPPYPRRRRLTRTAIRPMLDPRQNMPTIVREREKGQIVMEKERGDETMKREKEANMFR